MRLVSGMELTREQYARVTSFWPVHLGGVLQPNLQVTNAVLIVAANDCK